MKNEWLAKAVFYEVYPTSFYDSNGDGIGDIEGIIQKLDYIENLGANAIWLNPCFQSPFMDGGYDITDYKKVDSKFGTNDDLIRLFAEAKKRGIRILLDLVMGHTSIYHPWFRQSQKDEINEHTDTYIWQPGSDPLLFKDGKFLSGMSQRPAMFRINFYAVQPALNYGYYHKKAKWQTDYRSDIALKNRQKVVDVCKFWLSLGAEGFRVDMAGHMVKNDRFDMKGNRDFWNDVIGRVKSEYPDCAFVSEWFYPSQSVGGSAFDVDFHVGYGFYSLSYGDANEKMIKGNQNSFFGANSKKTSFFSGNSMYRLFQRNVKGKGYQAITMTNHDRIRFSFGRSEEAIKTAFAFHLTYPHVPFVYYGDETGMQYQVLQSKDGGYRRTGSRTPMQWDESENRGFSTAESDKLYLPVSVPDGHSVEAQKEEENSILQTVKKLIGLRNRADCLRADASLRFLKKGRYLLYRIRSKKDEVYVLLSPKAKAFSVKLNFLKGKSFETLTNARLKEGRIEGDGENFAVFYRKI